MTLRNSCRRTSGAVQSHLFTADSALPSSRRAIASAASRPSVSAVASTSSVGCSSSSSSSSNAPPTSKRPMSFKASSSRMMSAAPKRSLDVRSSRPSTTKWHQTADASGPARPADSKFASTSAPEATVSPDGSLTPQRTAEEVASWFSERYPSLALPDDVLVRAITHESWDHGLGLDGNNRRLSFLGRRAMHLFMSLFLSAHLNAGNAAASSSASRLLSSNDEVEGLLQTARIGDTVGRALKLEEVMRWKPVVAEGEHGPKETGLFKTRGTTVEALVGAIYHQRGAAVARAFFDSRVLPELSTIPKDAREELRAAIQSAAARGQEVLNASSRSYTSGAVGQGQTRSVRGSSPRSGGMEALDATQERVENGSRPSSGA